MNNDAKVYIARLEAEVEQLQSQLAKESTQYESEAAFIRFARLQAKRGEDISSDAIRSFFSRVDDINEPLISRFIYKTKAICKSVHDFVFSDKLFTYVIVPSLLICVLVSISLLVWAIISDTKGRNKALEIDAAMLYDVNGDNLILDDERKIKLHEFMKKHGLTISEDDFIKCVREKKYNGFVKDGKSLSYQEILDLINSKVEK
jgi:hypothetical protein